MKEVLRLFLLQKIINGPIFYKGLVKKIIMLGKIMRLIIKLKRGRYVTCILVATLFVTKNKWSWWRWRLFWWWWWWWQTVLMIVGVVGDNIVDCLTQLTLDSDYDPWQMPQNKTWKSTRTAPALPPSTCSHLQHGGAAGFVETNGRILAKQVEVFHIGGSCVVWGIQTMDGGYLSFVWSL